MGISSFHILLGFYILRKRRLLIGDIRSEMMHKLVGDEKIYFFIFIVLFAIQVYYVTFFQIGPMSYDDAAYVVQSESAIEDNGMYLTNEYTGESVDLRAKRVFNSYPIFVAYLSYMSDVPVVIMAHTILAVYFLFLAYFIYYYFSKQLFSNQVNRYIFLVFLSLSNIYGYYSPYSFSFRLLGPIWQGKSIAMALILPFAFAYLLQLLNEEYDKRNVLLILILGLASCATTLMGAIMLVAIFVGVSCIYGILMKKKEYLKYSVAISIGPLLCALGYLIMK